MAAEIYGAQEVLKRKRKNKRKRRKKRKRGMVGRRLHGLIQLL